MKNEITTQIGARKSAFERCKFCGGMVNLDDEGVQYPNGTAAHEHCADSDDFNRQNASDFRD